jgi:enamine deaminase RidA (YjgF/YER057c/UK114 family)
MVSTAMTDEIINPGELFDATEFGFSQARARNGVLHISGQIGVDSELRVAGDDVESQARKAFENLGVALEAAGKGYDDVGKVVTYMVDLKDNVGGYREPWSEVFDEPYPCHTLIGVDQLSPIADGELLVELDVEVVLDE